MAGGVQGGEIWNGLVIAPFRHTTEAAGQRGSHGSRGAVVYVEEAICSVSSVLPPLVVTHGLFDTPVNAKFIVIY